VPDQVNTIETPFRRSHKYRIALAITGTATEDANQMDIAVFMISAPSGGRNGDGSCVAESYHLACLLTGAGETADRRWLALPCSTWQDL
jgi:hypothetical protein